MIAGVVAAVVILIAAVVGVSAFGSGQDSSSASGSASSTQSAPVSTLSASDTVKAYLEALSAGDATKALSFGLTTPSNTGLLTNGVLRQQIAKMPITNIRILGEDKSLAGLGEFTVHVSVNFGPVVDDAEIDLKLNDDKVWKLETAAVKIDPPFNATKGSAGETVSIFGKDFKNGSLYVFPGYLDFGSSNDYVAATAESVFLEGLRTYTSTTLDPEISLNDNGRRAVHDQLVAAFANCEGSNLLSPPNCPAEVGFPDAVDGTVTWGVADLSGVEIGALSPWDLSVILGGRARIPLSYQTTSGGTKEGISTAYMAGKADLTKTPPELVLRG